MSNTDNKENPALKQRISAEIASQVEEFLRSGGNIEVVDNHSVTVAAMPKGSVWDDSSTSNLLG
ncbi:hypothetical protein EYC98_02375 [Halieaceae bacterium IMCC14734]|uniref:Transcriptional regulator SutA RNAP-binding domain-containing protein n=1 Tax=Candidatus Litorirhabdus singularis TaxID=2518993 RepID=A0ABT3TBP5_9GAMM|nr:hypothetical protein [Candidatus Litorirhabdus singularis]MCX2979704.1 hypothetical protein [Candidatus Litorirhabdus singularis]